MLTRSPLAAFGAALTIALASLASTPVMAQTPQSTRPDTDQDGRPVVTDSSGGIAGRTRNRNRNRAPAPPSPEEIKVAAQTIATNAGSSCQVNEASFLGVNAEQQSAYEAACASGPGYILIGSTPPQAIDCVVLAGQADLDRSRDPAADVGIQCKLPINTDITRVIDGYAKEASIACAIDQGASIGKSSAGNFIYEVGCKDLDGFWLEKMPTGWKTTSCLQIVTQSAACRFTTPVEQAATVKTMLVGSAAAACDVTEARYMGGNANGTFYEAKCGAGDGLIARFNAEQVVQEVYPCAAAVRIGGGCKLTTVATAPAAPAPAPAAN